MSGFEAAAQRTDEAALREQERALQRVRFPFSSFPKPFSPSQIYKWFSLGPLVFLERPSKRERFKGFVSTFHPFHSAKFNTWFSLGLLVSLEILSRGRFKGSVSLCHPFLNHFHSLMYFTWLSLGLGKPRQNMLHPFAFPDNRPAECDQLPPWLRKLTQDLNQNLEVNRNLVVLLKI